jgi:hypothetical protein
MAAPKSIAEAIAAGIPALGDVRDTLLSARDSLISFGSQYPDLKGKTDKAIAEIDAKLKVLDTAMSGEALRQLGVTVLTELAAIPSEGLKPLYHAGAGTGG